MVPHAISSLFVIIPSTINSPSGLPLALVSIHSLTEMIIRNIYWGKGGRCLVLTTLPHSSVEFLEI
jgi:hypothetical protein